MSLLPASLAVPNPIPTRVSPLHASVGSVCARVSLSVGAVPAEQGDLNRCQCQQQHIVAECRQQLEVCACVCVNYTHVLESYSNTGSHKLPLLMMLSGCRCCLSS
jgi:hypothetical protein